MVAEKVPLGVEPLPGDTFKFNLNLNQRICWLFLVPTALHCAVYIADVATDIALVERHIAEERCLLASFTLAFIYAPALVFLIFIFKDKRRWPPDEEGAGQKVVWVLKQILKTLLFPLHALHRFAGKLFWALEAISGPREQLEESLAEAMKPSFAELYLLLQPFIQALPQALLQTFVIMSYKVPQTRTGVVQILSITTSILSTAIAAACYMRFESKRQSGKQTPWAFDRKPVKTTLEQKESLMTTIDSQVTANSAGQSPEPEGSPKTAPLPKGVPHTAILSLPPLPPNIRARLLKASGDDLPEDLQKEISDSEEPLNIRSSLYGAHVGGNRAENEIDTLEFSITLPSISPTMPRSPVVSLPPSPLPPLPPSPPPGGSPLHEAPLPPLPISPPPSPQTNEDLEEEDDESYEGSVHEAPTNEATGTTTPETNLAEHPSREPLIDQSTTSLNENPPSPPPRFSKPLPPIEEIQIEGLTEDEVIGKGIAFIWWLLFILSRILALATLAFFYPYAFLVVTLLHYLVMTSYLFSSSPADRTSTTILRFSLGFVFLFCFLEFRDRFRDPRGFAVSFVALCSVENMISSAVWFLIATWTSWWFLYTFYIINASLMLSILVMGLFHVIFKPGPANKIS